MKSKNTIILLAAALFLFACNQSERTPSTLKTETDNPRQSSDTTSVDNNHLTMAVLYQQQSAEYVAACQQAFLLAKYALDKDLKNLEIDQARAVVLDIDETVLDNSPYEAKCILDGIQYPEQWNEWCQLVQAKEIPGAVDFINYARAYGVDIYFITNRKEELRAVTLENLAYIGIENVDDKHLLMRGNDRSKKSRREEVMQNHHISLFIGDNLNDFSESFEGLNNEQRKNKLSEMQTLIGSRFITIPNAMYGDWEMALYNYNSALGNDEKERKRHILLKDFQQLQVVR